MNLRKLTGLLSLFLLLLSSYMIFWYAPLEKVMREVQKIFYVHVGTAWNAFLAFAVVFAASVVYLKTRDRRWDAVAESSAELGVLFTTLVLITGPIWGHSAWGTWWTWEPRLTTTLILWFVYLAYLLIRQAVQEEERRLSLAAIFGIVGFVNVPIVYFSIYWWASKLHPVVVGSGGGGLETRMLQTLIVTVFAFTALYAYLLQLGTTIAGTKSRLETIKQALRENLE